MSRLKRWFSLPWRRERRQAERSQPESIVAHYWTGGPPCAKTVRDISARGVYIYTKEPMYPGTNVRLTLQNNDILGEDSTPVTVAVDATVVRSDETGMGLFVPFQAADIDTLWPKQK